MHTLELSKTDTLLTEKTHTEKKLYTGLKGLESKDFGGGAGGVPGLYFNYMDALENALVGWVRCT